MSNSTLKFKPLQKIDLSAKAKTTGDDGLGKEVGNDELFLSYTMAPMKSSRYRSKMNAHFEMKIEKIRFWT
jgi:hypothetical protein